MVTPITDFKQFAETINNANKHTVTFKVAGEEYSITYAELTSNQDVKSKVEFSEWFKRNYEKLTDNQRIISTALEVQWNIWKMIKPFVQNVVVFEDFLNLPPQVVTEMIKAIEDDIKARYPRLNLKL